MKTGTLVIVNGTQVGVVEYTDPTDGMIAVNLAGEGNRVDLWHPNQVAAFE